MIKSFALPILLCLVGACAKEAAPVVDSAAAAARAPTAATVANAPTCPRTGHWTECTFRIRLDQSGLAPIATSEKIGDLPSLPGTPLLFKIGNAGLAAYLYPDTLTRRKAAATLDTLAFIPQTTPISMKGEGTLIQNDNVLVILFSKNEHQRERTADAITAGPPQP